MTSKAETTFTVVSDLEAVMTRVFDAPRDLVYEACSQARHMRQWWGPRQYSLPVCEMDARPGGTYRMVQRSSDGTEHPFRGEFLEVVPPDRLVFTQVYEPYADHPIVVTLTFEDLGDGRTRYSGRMRFDSIESRDATLGSGMESGARESYERLAEHLAVLDRGIWFERVFEAPRALVFDMWTDPKHVAQWWGPDGFTNSIQEMDVRPGGVWRFTMHGPDGVDYPNRIVFVEVVRPERLVYDHGADSPDGADFRAEVFFGDEGPRTRLTMRNLFASSKIREMVSREFHAVEGGQQTLDRLAAYLEAVGE
jgi:uncharacterized protein YndB with AHSA1/START domain